jgi:hypothetical protein
MNDLRETLNAWGASLCSEVAVGGLLARNRTAHKWKVTLRVLIVRECICWRTHDLLNQAFVLHSLGHALGSRILIRSAFESVALLVYLNEQIRAVSKGALSFNAFQELSLRLLMGSKNGSTDHAAVNVLTLLEKCDKKFNGILDQYHLLSESAHPNFDGVCMAYSRSDKETLSTSFQNNLMQMHARGNIAGIELCVLLFNSEYNDEWPAAFQELEDWLVANDADLERTKDAL